MIALATSVRAGDPGPLSRLAADAGFQGVAIDGGLALSRLRSLLLQIGPLRLPLTAMTLPLPEEPLRPGRTLPRLLALDDAEERDAALALFQRDLAAGVDLGVARYAVEASPVKLAARREVCLRALARRELAEGEPGGRAWRAVREERAAQRAAVLDAGRRALDRLAPEAERAGVRLALLPAVDPWQAPSPRELATLLAEFAGAPLGAAFAPGRMAALGAWGLGAAEERRRELAQAAVAVHATDAVGVDADLAPGLGETPPDEIAWTPDDAPIVVAGRTDTTLAELRRAREALAAIRAAASQNEGASASLRQ